MRTEPDHNSGYTLVETIIGVGVMALVITGGLVALGQATLLSEKSADQVMADFVLRSEVESLRAAEWTTVASLHDRITDYLNVNSTEFGYPELTTLDQIALAEKGLGAEVMSARLNNAGETGKIIFRILLNWKDRSGHRQEEARAMVITEGGISADL